MKKFYLLVMMFVILCGCVFDGFRSLYGDEWIEEQSNWRSEKGEINGKSTSSSTTTIATTTTATGSVMLSNGTVVPYSSSMVLTDSQKTMAVGIIFSDSNNKYYMVGINQAKNKYWSTYSGTLNTYFTKIGSTYNHTTGTFSGNTDGSKNWGYICEADSVGTQNPATNYPVFDYALTYASTSGLNGVYSTGWYVPSLYEMYCIYRNRTAINKALSACGKTQLKGVYWTSSQDSSRNVPFDAADFQFNESWYGDYSSGKSSEPAGVVVIRQIDIVKYQYTISFNANGGDGTMDSISINGLTETALPVCKFTPPTDMKFAHWNDASDDSGQVYNDGSKISRLTSTDGETVTLYAIWMDKYAHRIIYSDAMNAVNTNLTVFSEKESVILSDISKTGYTFNGWFDAQTGGTKVMGWSAGTRTDDVNLWARWTANQYNIIYKDESGDTFSGVHGANYPTAHTYGKDTTLVSPTKAGNIFEGWYSQSDCTGLSLTKIGSTDTTADITVYAKWSVGVRCSVSELETNLAALDENGGPYKVIITDSEVDHETIIAALRTYKNVKVHLDLSAVINGGHNVFDECGLVSIILPEHINGWSLYNYYAACPYFQQVIVSENNNCCKSIDGVLFNKDGTELYCYPRAKTETLYTIPDSVTSIGDFAFYGCSGLTSITIPDGVTSIGGSAFNGCTSLTSVTMGNNVTQVGGGAFDNCPAIRYAQLGSNGAYALSKAGYSFRTSGAVYDLRYLYNYDGYDYELTGLEISNVDKNITSITIPDGVTRIGDWAFYGCTDLTGALVIPSGVTYIGSGAFNGCMNLTSLTIPSSVTTLVEDIFWSANEYGASIFNIEKIIILMDTIPACPIAVGLTSHFTGIYVPDDMVDDYRDADDWYNYANLIHGVSEMGGTHNDENVTKAASEVMDYLTGLEYYGQTVNITISDTTPDLSFIKEAMQSYQYVRVNLDLSGCTGLTGCLYASFSGCTGLVGVTLPDTVTDIDRVFSGCSGLTSFTIGSNVSYIHGNAFEGCSSLINIYIPANVSNIENGVFNNCSSMTSITVASDNPNYKDIDSVLYSKDGTTLIQCPAGKTIVAISADVTSISDGAFAGCENLTRVDYAGTIEQWCAIELANFGLDNAHDLYIGGSLVTDLVIPDTVTEIKANAFSGCSITSITFGSGVETIGDRAFYKCSGLTNVTIPNTVTSIEGSAFRYSSVTNITIGSGVTSIGNDAFADCSSMTTLTILAETPPTINNGSLYFDNNTLTAIRVPADSVTAYRNKAGWKDYRSKITAIE